MKKCPNCNEETIPLKWILFEKANGQKGRCYICDNCGEKIKKRRIFGFIGDILDSEIGLVVLLGLSIGFNFLINAFFFFLLFALMTMFFFYLLIDLFAVLTIADESYCRGDMTKIGAFFGLIAMGAIIAYMVYFFLIRPFLR